MTTQANLARELPAPYPPTIRVSRAKARQLIDLCELAEMTCNVDCIMGMAGNGSSSSSSSKDKIISPYISVIEMSLLLYLGEYTHARHLWRRCRASARGGQGTDDGGHGDLEYAQLEMLWNAARYCYLWSTGGIYSLKSGLGGSSSSSTTGVGVGVDGGDSSAMQVEDSTFNTAGGDVNLPFSALALQALQSCRVSKMEPLATYSAELIEVFRSKVNDQMHRSFERIKLEEFCARLNLNQSSADATNEFGNNYGWVVDSSVGGENAGPGDKKSGVYLTSDPDWEPYYQDDDVLDDGTALLSNGRLSHHQDVIPNQLLSNEDRIRKLTDVVMFMEQCKMNA